jgi:hypothetical protein
MVLRDGRQNNARRYSDSPRVGHEFWVCNVFNMTVKFILDYLKQVLELECILLAHRQLSHLMDVFTNFRWGISIVFLLHNVGCIM